MGLNKTLVELFAGVGGFRVGFEAADSDWTTLWANQWEPGAQNQHAFVCYKHHFEKAGGLNEFSNVDIHKVPSKVIPKHTLLVGGFPCQDYSVAGTKTKGIEGKKGVLWWDIERIVKDKKPPFILLENVDRLIKSPAKQRGRDFGMILACLNNLGYYVEWRVVNAEDYGLQQRRRRTFIFAVRKNTTYGKFFKKHHDLNKDTLFARVLPVKEFDVNNIKHVQINGNLLDMSNHFAFCFENAGIMYDGDVYTVKTDALSEVKHKKTLDELLEYDVDDKYVLTDDVYKKFVYMKGPKKEERTAKTGFKYFYTEGPVPFPDYTDRAARTLLTSEGSNNRSTHIVKDKKNGKLRKLTPVECERIDGFPDNWTNTGMPEKFRYFCMGNALVVDLIQIIATGISEIIDAEN